VGWINTTGLSFREGIANAVSAFEENRLAWNSSDSCAMLRPQLKQMPATKKVKKVVCFEIRRHLPQTSRMDEKRLSFRQE
jgi:hypothetical protein